MGRPSLWLGIISALLLAASAARLTAQPARGPILHEYLEPDPVEDIALGSKTSHGQMAAAIQTPAGPVAAPEERPPSTSEPAYGASAHASSEDASYRLDNDTSRPEVVGYDDPFTPQIPPYKRLYAFDTVNRDLELVVSDARLQAVPLGGRANADDDQFYGDLPVDFASDSPVRVPSVGPGTRVLTLYASPTSRVELMRDSADNWFLRSDKPGRARVIMHLALERAVFGSAFADVPWDALTPYVPSVPAAVQAAASDVAGTLGFAEAPGPKQALTSLVAYFRRFEPSLERPPSAGLNLYREIVFQQKGVCRHRAYAFMLTALGLGIPTRFVHNEAHAWVEVFDTYRWHRVDLGGAAGRLQMDVEDKAQHVVPRDPFAWPSGGESGQSMAQRSRQAPRDPAAGIDSATSPPSPDASPPEWVEQQVAPSQRAPEPTVEIKARISKVVRGAALSASGSAEREGRPCRFSRVDIELRAPDVGRMLIGTLVTDGDGRYQGSVSVPTNVVPGKYELVATVPIGSCQSDVR